jgi:hypothetical protein
MWVPGKFVAIDKQTIGFQGASGMKLCISYKRGGDGFQCNVMPDIYICSISDMGRLQTPETSSNIWSFPPRRNELCGWHPVC